MMSRPTRRTSVVILGAAAVLGFGGGAVLAPRGGVPGAGTVAEASPATPSSAPATLTLTTSAGSVASAAPFRLTGTLAPAAEKATVSVQRRLAEGDWTDFAVSATTKADGSFSTKVLTQRNGVNEFRVVTSVAGTQVASPAVTVTVG